MSVSASQRLRSLARIRSEKGKGHPDYAAAVIAFLDDCVDPSTGEILGRRGVCPGCAITSVTGLFDLGLRFVTGCALCADIGLACPTCRNGLWVRRGPAGYDPDDLGDNRVTSLIPCPTCAVHQGEAGYVRDGLRALQSLQGYYRGA